MRRTGPDRTGPFGRVLELQLDPVSLRERLLSVCQGRVGEASVAPPRAPAVADDERVRRVADEGDGVAAARRVRLVLVEVAGVHARVVPGRVDVEAGGDRPLRGGPGAPNRQVHA